MKNKGLKMKNLFNRFKYETVYVYTFPHVWSRNGKPIVKEYIIYIFKENSVGRRKIKIKQGEHCRRYKKGKNHQFYAKVCVPWLNKIEDNVSTLIDYFEKNKDNPTRYSLK